MTDGRRRSSEVRASLLRAPALVLCVVVAAGSMTPARSGAQTGAAVSDLPVTDAITRAGSPPPVSDLLYDGHFTIMQGAGTVRFTKGYQLYRTAAQKARALRDRKGEALARELMDHARLAVTRCRRAAEDARRDVRQGRYIEKTCGFPPAPAPWDGLLRETLRQRYGIRLVGVTGCDVSYEQLAEVAGYNSVAVPAREKRYGKGVIARVTAEVRRRWERRQK